MFAQTKNPVTDVIKSVLASRQKNITAAIEEMPADKFGFKPTPDKRPSATSPCTSSSPTIIFVRPLRAFRNPRRN